MKTGPLGPCCLECGGAPHAGPCENWHARRLRDLAATKGSLAIMLDLRNAASEIERLDNDIKLLEHDMYRMAKEGLPPETATGKNAIQREKARRKRAAEEPIVVVDAEEFEHPEPEPPPVGRFARFLQRFRS